MAQDHDLWNQTLDGLAVLGAPALLRVFPLQRQATPWSEFAVVADSFHTKPLRQFLQLNGRYQVLALSLQQMQLFEGERHVLDAVTLAPGAPQPMNAAPRAGKDWRYE
ncbi:hypothetical protein [Parazoarcus communis]|uniref:hypothetical protein n=1 Tax=Parazoarcus communis TaxID=41977 RepID=UPI00131F0367|nr:hypothetical protein [Parazoarcus communis]